MDHWDSVTEKLQALQADFERALERLRWALRNFFPDGLVVDIRPPYPHTTATERGVVVGMEPNLLIRVALKKDPACVCVVPWQDILPVGED